MSDEEIREIRKKLKDHGLTPIALSGHCNLISEERLQDFIENIELAGKFGCEFIVSFTGEAHFGINEGSRDDIKTCVDHIWFTLFSLMRLNCEYGKTICNIYE